MATSGKLSDRPDAAVEELSQLTIGHDAKHESSCEPRIKGMELKENGSTARCLPEDKASQYGERGDDLEGKATEEVDQLKPFRIIQKTSPEEIGRYREIY